MSLLLAPLAGCESAGNPLRGVWKEKKSEPKIKGLENLPEKNITPVVSEDKPVTERSASLIHVEHGFRDVGSGFP